MANIFIKYTHRWQNLVNLVTLSSVNKNDSQYAL